MKKYTCRQMICAMATVVVMAACTSQPTANTTVSHVMKATEVPNAPYGAIVVVGATPSRDTSRDVEEGIGKELKAHGVAAHSFVVESSSKTPTEDAMRELVLKVGADAVLVVSGKLAGAELKEHGEQVETDPRSIGGSLVNFFRYDYEETTLPAYTDITMDITLVANLYDVKSQKRVYMVEASTTDGESSYEIITEESKAMVARMKKDGVIR